MLGMIGEQFEDSDEIMGAVVQNRNRGHRIQLWTRNKENEAAIKRIGHKLKQLTELDMTFKYTEHNQKKVKYTI